MKNSRPTVLLGVTGSVAVFRAIDLASQLTKEGYLVDVVLTCGALQFVRPLSFEAVTHRCAYTDQSPGILAGRAIHIELAERAGIVVVAPATADLIGGHACGLAQDLLSSLLLATAAPVLLAPAMNTRMWGHPAVRDNVALLERRGVRFVGPESGLLSCGTEGPGRLWPVDQLYAKIQELVPMAAHPPDSPKREGKELAALGQRSSSLPQEGDKSKEMNEMADKKKPGKKPAVRKTEKNSKKGPAAKKK
ncbi:flavoprotein [Methylacidimicrobium tartarophylax]|uniref:Coenzyme A biosynthesis bifunctional protein CoaBC n=1 Tax=Methylacidimicrobium tartarophylax TaxID=1041768 RepID=A0A5E6MBB1_9BACT|nr:flavoprotein [Methylacidimicrobium tartarophylax]VVM06260.1 Coenzyme A biosynthesis bifunctional protein CoaBC [Methylacidimicrobium tartarophylax]